MRSAPRSSRSQRGAVLPSPVVILSIVAVALAALTFVVTRGDGPKEKDITPVAAPATTTDTSGATPTAPVSGATTGTTATTTTTPKPPKVIDRAKTGVVVFNDTSIKGLAAKVGTKVSAAGWHFVAADNWYGTVVSTTVYFPHGMKAAAHQLALDLGVQRVMPADISSNMSTTNLTLILTGPLN